MHVFLSAGEPSGDLHAANLLKHLRARQPKIEGFGFGGPHLQAAGGDVLFSLASHAIMGLGGVARALPTMVRILEQAATEVARRRPIAAVLIDYPGFHWHLARRLKRLGIPTISFVPPQIWAWASFRAKRMRKCFDRVLCSLPFEEQWFSDRGINAEYVGHPYFDHLHEHGEPDESARIEKLHGTPIVAVLPGSRSAELDRNLTGQVKALCRIRDRRPDVRFVVACFKDQHRLRVAEALERHRLVGQAMVGRMSEVLSVADAVIAVSGSVGLELLYHAVPSAIVYRVNPLYRAIANRVLNVPHISIVNILAGRELFPEFLTSRDVSVELADRVLHWLDNPNEVAGLRRELAALREHVGQPGACARAAQVVLGMAEGRAAA